MIRTAVLATFLAASCATSFAQDVLPGLSVRIARPKDGTIEFKDVSLKLDDGARRLSVISKDAPLDVAYDDVGRLIVEPDTSWHRPSIGALLGSFAVGGMLFGPSLAASVDNPLKMTHLIYLEHRRGDQGIEPYVLSVNKEATPAVLRRLKSVFGERLATPAFPERREILDGERYKSVPKYEVRGSDRHPEPELKRDKALVVITCPGGGGLKSAADKYTRWGGLVLLNDQAVAMTAPGTYTTLELDPGEHFLVSLGACPGRCRDATGLRITVEAGKEYYLVHTVYVAGTVKSLLARHSKEIVMLDLPDLRLADWRVVN